MKDRRKPLAKLRKPRADAQRNRELLLATAKAAFTELGPEASLEDIARRAGVGIGTLYRHFPTRSALLEAVYHREVEGLAQSVDALLAEFSPGEALRRWLHLCIDYLATKKVVAAALGSHPGGAATGTLIRAAARRLVEEGIAAGDVRADFQPEDLMSALAAFSYGAGEPAWKARARRLADIVVAGLRPVPSEAKARRARRPSGRST